MPEENISPLVFPSLPAIIDKFLALICPNEVIFPVVLIVLLTCIAPENVDAPPTVSVEPTIVAPVDFK